MDEPITKWKTTGIGSSHVIGTPAARWSSPTLRRVYQIRAEPDEPSMPTTRTERTKSSSRQPYGKNKRSLAPAEQYGHLNPLPDYLAVNLESTSSI